MESSSDGSQFLECFFEYEKQSDYGSVLIFPSFGLFTYSMLPIVFPVFLCFNDGYFLGISPF